MEYSIGEFARVTGINACTLRYYEKEGLIAPERKHGQRCYSDAEVSWMQFVKRLKATDMPIKTIQEYAQLRAEGDSTLEERMEMLIQHRAILSKRIAAMQESLKRLDDKISYYKTEIES